MISKLIYGILNLITKVVGILLYPIDALITTLLPNVSDAMISIQNYLNLPAQYMGWIFTLVNIPTLALTLIISYWVFKYAITGAVAGIKMTITLYQKFKP